MTKSPIQILEDALAELKKTEKEKRVSLEEKIYKQIMWECTSTPVEDLENPGVLDRLFGGKNLDKPFLDAVLSSGIVKVSMKIQNRGEILRLCNEHLNLKLMPQHWTFPAGGMHYWCVNNILHCVGSGTHILKTPAIITDAVWSQIYNNRVPVSLLKDVYR